MLDFDFSLCYNDIKALFGGCNMPKHTTLSLDPNNELSYSFATNNKPYLQMHDHKFYEITIVTSGSICHHINSSVQTIPCNTMIFIRPQDVHYFSGIDDSEFEYINLPFPKTLLYELVQYMGEGFDIDQINKSILPPMITLSSTDTLVIRDIVNRFSFMSPDKHESKMTYYKLLIADLFFRYIQVPIEEQTQYPSWLNEIVQKMSDPVNFSRGITGLVEISGKNLSYISRVFKKYLQCTPTAFINDIRLNYCANRLIHTDAEIIEIAMDAGFNNLSHFYHLFKEKYHMSPKKFRKDKLIYL